MNLAYPINSLWMWSCLPGLRLFHHSTKCVQKTQTRILTDIIGNNSDCVFGREHNFASCNEVDAFRNNVPICDYENIAPWIDQIRAGRHGVLTTEAVKLLEPTSGSVGGRRLIPYTDSLRRQFQNGINPWIGDLFSNRPGVRRGRAYWMVSPTMEPQETDSEVPIGFADDTQYLGLFGRLAAGRVMAVPPWTMDGVSPREAPWQTLLQLLTVPDLSLVSVWSPTFIVTLIRLLDTSFDRLIATLRENGNSKAADRVQSIFHSKGVSSDSLQEFWPRLKLISCWADASAAHGVHDLRRLFPNAEIQAKGLISTEAFVSLPLVGHSGSALSVRSHFFEFQSVENASEKTQLAHELSVGKRYRVIVTTGGGLYRYQTHDVIEVVGFFNECPLLRFCGRDNKTSDLVGEKLSERFVADAITAMAQQLDITLAFAMLVPQQNPPGYRLLVERDDENAHSDTVFRQTLIERMRNTLERQLEQNPYYQHAIQIGQLAPLAVSLNESSNRFWDHYESKCLATGMRQGDIKPTALETRFEWDGYSEESGG